VRFSVNVNHVPERLVAVFRVVRVHRGRGRHRRLAAYVYRDDRSDATGQLSVESRVLRKVSGKVRQRRSQTLRRKVLRRRPPDDDHLVSRVRQPSGRAARRPPTGIQHVQFVFGTCRPDGVQMSEHDGRAASSDELVGQQRIIAAVVSRPVGDVLFAVRASSRGGTSSVFPYFCVTRPQIHMLGCSAIRNFIE